MPVLLLSSLLVVVQGATTDWPSQTWPTYNSNANSCDSIIATSTSSTILFYDRPSAMCACGALSPACKYIVARAPCASVRSDSEWQMCTNQPPGSGTPASTSCTFVKPLGIGSAGCPSTVITSRRRRSYEPMGRRRRRSSYANDDDEVACAGGFTAAHCPTPAWATTTRIVGPVLVGAVAVASLLVRKLWPRTFARGGGGGSGLGGGGGGGGGGQADRDRLVVSTGGLGMWCFGLFFAAMGTLWLTLAPGISFGGGVMMIGPGVFMLVGCGVMAVRATVIVVDKSPGVQALRMHTRTCLCCVSHRSIPIGEVAHLHLPVAARGKNGAPLYRLTLAKTDGTQLPLEMGASNVAIVGRQATVAQVNAFLGVPGAAAAAGPMAGVGVALNDMLNRTEALQQQFQQQQYQQGGGMPMATVPVANPVAGGGAGVGGGGSAMVQQLAQLAQLRASGALSVAEFEAAKAQLLGGSSANGSGPSAPPKQEAGSTNAFLAFAEANTNTPGLVGGGGPAFSSSTTLTPGLVGAAGSSGGGRGFCSNCGTKVSGTSFCINCGQPAT